MSGQLPEPAPYLLPASGGTPSQEVSLWRNAPTWRYLFITALGLSTALISLPLTLTPSDSLVPRDQQVCNANANPAALGPFLNQPSVRGQIVGFLTPDQTMHLLESTQRSAGMTINPNYVANVRALVKVDGGPDRVVALVPNGLIVHPGNRVEFAGGHVDPTLPCHYLPNLITKISF